MVLNITHIDNVDPQVVYGGVWTQHPNTDAFNGTISLTRRVGNTATLMFTGNSVAVYGQLGPHPPDAPAVTKYEIDDSDAITFSPSSPAGDLKRLLFFQSRAYPYGTHKLVLTNMIDLDWIWLDYFEVTNNGDPSQTLHPNPTFTPSVLGSSSSKPSTGVIVGAALGGLIGALLIMGAILLLWRRKKRAEQAPLVDYLPVDSESSYSPFRRSEMINVERSYPSDNILGTSYYSSTNPSAVSPEPTSYPAFTTIPPAKMRQQPHLQAEQPQPYVHLPAYST